MYVYINNVASHEWVRARRVWFLSRPGRQVASTSPRIGSVRVESTCSATNEGGPWFGIGLLPLSVAKVPSMIEIIIHDFVLQKRLFNEDS